MDIHAAIRQARHPEFLAVRRQLDPMGWRMGLKSAGRRGRWWEFNPGYNFLIRNTRDHEAMKIRERSVKSFPILRHRVGTGNAANWNLLGVGHFLQIDQIDLLIAHGRHKYGVVIAGVI